LKELLELLLNQVMGVEVSRHTGKVIPNSEERLTEIRGMI
jgi:hypothetical protein